jgi:hypothetical protein
MSRRLHTTGYQFVEFVPETLASGILYISVEYKTMAHLCFCGCGMKVVTPLSPTGWALTFDGRGVSIAPSVGNWNLKCRSHYVISGNRIEWAGSWTTEQIAAGFARDQAAKARYYGQSEAVSPAANVPAQERPRRGRWSKVLDFFFR